MTAIAKRVFQELCPPIIYRAAATLKANLPSKTGNELVPWGPSYSAAKQAYIGEALSDAPLMNSFSTSQALPERFGVGIDERCVELPWLLSRIGEGSAEMLDAGSALNHAYILDLVPLRTKKLHIATLSPERNCFAQRGIGYFYEDIRRLPFESEAYDCISCISTLEHVGCDNTAYTQDGAHAEQKPEDYLLAVKEISRVLRPEGSLFITVPFGKYERRRSFQQFDESMVDRVIEAFGTSRSVSSTYYKYGADGWNVATASDCNACEYVNWAAEVWDGAPWPNPLPVEPDRAAAARAVACVHLMKS